MISKIKIRIKLVFLLGLLLLVANQNILAQEVEVIGDLKITNGSQGQGKILMSDSSGVATWITPHDLLIETHKNLPGGLRRLILWGFSPIELWNSGVPYDSLIGINVSEYNFDNHLIFYVDTLDIYPFSYLITGIEGLTFGTWPCDGMAISGADSPSFGDGAQNSNDVISGCPSANPQTNPFVQVTNQGGPGWHIASTDEALLIYNKLIITGLFDPVNSPFYWTSTEATGANEVSHVMVINKNTGSITEQAKSMQYRAMTVKVIPD